jgi:hypothetical protein
MHLASNCLLDIFDVYFIICDHNQVLNTSMQIYVLNLGLLKWRWCNNLNPLAILLSIVRHELATNLIQVTCLNPIWSFCEMFKYKTNGDKYFI